VLIPLLDLAPDAQLPGSGERLIDKRAHLRYHRIIRKFTGET